MCVPVMGCSRKKSNPVLYLVLKYQGHSKEQDSLMMELF